MLVPMVIRVKKDDRSPCIVQLVTSIPRSLTAISERIERQDLDAANAVARSLNVA
jgi:hypothetical protein